MSSDAHFSFDRSVPLPEFLYLLTTTTTTKSECWKLTKKVFFHHRAIENFDHHGHVEFAIKGFWMISVKEGFQL